MKNITKELKEYMMAHNLDWRDWHTLKYDGRMKMFKGISKKEFAEAQAKHFKRNYIYDRNESRYMQSGLRRAYNYIREWAAPRNKSYQKVAMYGHTWLYACSPVYGHNDYNKARLLEIKGHEKQCEWLIKISDRISGLNNKNI